MSEETALGLGKDDFYDLYRRFRPEVGRAEFEHEWEDFQQQKRQREAKRNLQ